MRITKLHVLLFCFVLCVGNIAFSQQRRTNSKGRTSPPRPSSTPIPRQTEVIPDLNKEVSYLLPFQSPSPKKIPLILIHGIRPTAESGENIGRYNHYWDAALSRLNSEGYAVYLFQYRTDRLPVQKLSESLGIWIDATIPDRQHIILAHSMGGLIAKSYMADYVHRKGVWQGKKAGDTVLGLITLATPHHGSPLANNAFALDRLADPKYVTHVDIVNSILKRSEQVGYSSFSKNSNEPNRSDLRWDNFDNSLSADMNSWLLELNKRFEPYNSKIISYTGMMPYWGEPNMILITNGILSLTGSMAGLGGEIEKAYKEKPYFYYQYLDAVLTFAYKGHFGRTDGVVPIISSLQCKSNEQSFIAPGSFYICDSPFRVRRFESITIQDLGKLDLSKQRNILSAADAIQKAAGEIKQVEAKSLPANTLSITQNFLGYDHSVMKERAEIIDFILKDLASIARK